MHEQTAAVSPGNRRTLKIVLVGVACLIAVAVVLNVTEAHDGFGLIGERDVTRSYLATFMLVALDGVMPVFPGETTLNLGATLAAQGSLELWLVMASGAAGAIVGDSALFWLARLNADRFRPSLERARRAKRTATALEYLDRGAPMLIVAGRYVPGMRFVVGTTMGISGVPYRKFLPWSMLGGVAWAVYTCGLAYLIGTALAEFPLASVAISGVVTTVILAALFTVDRRKRRRGAPGPS